jgi:hypothetical protein
LVGLSRVAFRDGRHDEVVRLATECWRERFAETRRLLEENGIVLDPDDASELAALASRFG